MANKTISVENHSFLATLDEFIRVTNEIIDKLQSALEWMKGHHQRCNVAKTVGTSATVAGAGVVMASLFLAPFTRNLTDATSTEISSFLILYLFYRWRFVGSRNWLWHISRNYWSCRKSDN